MLRLAKEQKRATNIQEQKDVIQSGLNTITGKYDIIVIDPPWEYGTNYNPETRRVASPYPEMSQQELLNINLPSEDNCILWLWTTHKFIFDAKELINKWGFEYKCILVWDKDKMGMESWLRMQAEFCLFAIKGKPLWDSKNIRDIIREPRREHSRKPEGFYQMIDNNFIGKKLDYFSRNERNGWDVFGNNTEKFGLAI